MSLYTLSDIDLLRKKADDIKSDVAKQRATIIEPYPTDVKRAHNIIIDFCKSKQRKIYGGFALHLLLKNKDATQGIYNETSIPDIDIYSPEPINDLYYLCNYLHTNGFKYISGTEAVHSETYTIKYYSVVLCDLSYVPKNIYHKMPTFEINGLQVIHPNFMTIDYLRMESNPIDSYWRFFECSDLKSFTRFVKLQNAYPFPHDSKELNMDTIIDKPHNNQNNILIEIFNYLLNKTSVIVIGIYAYNCFMITINFKLSQIPYYEFISVDYKKDCLDLIEILQKKSSEIKYQEMYPWFQYTDYSVEIYIKNTLICRIYNNNHKCIPYQDVPAYNFNIKKVIKLQHKIRIGTFSLVLLHFLIDAQKMRVNSEKEKEKFFYNVVSYCIRARLKYFTSYKKNFLDNSIFKEFTTTCIGNEISSEKQMLLRIENRKKSKKPLVYRYVPAEKYQEVPPTFIFHNTSGNVINNVKNLQLTSKDESESEPESDLENEPEIESEIDITVSEKN
jgi:hypothetical protein